MEDAELNAKEGSWRLFMTRNADPGFQAFSERVCKSFSYRCSFCGFTSLKNLDIINLDGDYRNNKMSNLRPACPFCSQCFFLEVVGKGDFGGGFLIYTPEMTQAQVSALCHVFLSSIVLDNDFVSHSKDAYRLLKSRSSTVESILGKELSSPSAYGQMLIDMPDNAKVIHDQVKKKFRLLPNLKRFSKLAVEWSEKAINDLSK